MASTDATAIPVKNQAYRVTFPIWDADGDLVTGAASLDSEVSKDGGTFADCTNEATEIATSSGMYYLDLTSTEMNADTVAVIVKTSTSGAKTTPIILYPQEAGDLKVNVTYWNGTAVSSPATAGIPDINVKNINNVAATSVTTVNANIGMTQPINFTGTGASALVKGDAVDIAGSAVSTSSAQIGVNVVSYASGEAPLKPTVAGRTLDVSAGGEAGVDWANVGSPTTSNNLSGTTISTSQAVASVSGAVGSVTGNVGGNVAGSVASVTAGVTVTTNNDKTGYALSSAGVQAIWDALTSALSTASSIGKLLVDNINATISSRLASASYTAPLDAAGTRTAIGLASANLDTQLTAIDDYLDTEIAAIKAQTDLIPAQPAAIGSAMTLTSGERNSVADALLNRDMSAVSVTNSRSPINALRFLRNKWSISGATLTVTAENDSTTAWTTTLTTDGSADPITGSDPS